MQLPSICATHVITTLITTVITYSAVREAFTAVCNLCGQRGAAYLLPRLEHLRRVSDATAPAAAAEAGSVPAPKAAMPSAGPRADAAAAAGSRRPKVPPASLLKEKELRLMQLPFPSSTKIGSRWLGSWLHRLLRLIEISSSHASVLRANIRSGYDEPMTGS